MNLYKKVEKFVIETFEKSGDARDIPHLQRTVYWLKQLKPDADESLLIAAVSHDIERAFRDKNYSEGAKGFTSNDHIKYHSDKGAKIISDFLEKEKVPKNTIKRVKNLIKKHEVGGDESSNILKDADCISFFENNVDVFLKRQLEKVGKEKAKIKIDWMFNKITSLRAKDICRKWYNEVLEKVRNKNYKKL